MYKTPSDDTFKRFGAVVLTNAKNGSMSRPSIDINNLPEFFTFKNLPDANTGTTYEILRTDKSTIYEIRGLVFVGFDPDTKQLGEYLIRFNPNI